MTDHPSLFTDDAGKRTGAGCKIEVCDNSHCANGFCKLHYSRWERGDRGAKLRRPKQARMGNGGQLQQPAPTETPTMREIWWAAGFLEGEGHFRHDEARVSAKQVKRGPLDKLAAWFGGNVKKHKSEKHQDYHRYMLSSSRARGLMMTVYPLMSDRRKKQIRESLQ